MQCNKFLKIFLSISICTSFAFAKCYYIPCDSNIQSAKSSSKNQISLSFNEVKNKLKLLEQAYQEELNELKSSNELLRKQIAIKKQTLLETKELIFLLKQNNHLKANSIEKESIQGDN